MELEMLISRLPSNSFWLAFFLWFWRLLRNEGAGYLRRKDRNGVRSVPEGRAGVSSSWGHTLLLAGSPRARRSFQNSVLAECPPLGGWTP